MLHNNRVYGTRMDTFLPFFPLIDHGVPSVLVRAEDQTRNDEWFVIIFVVV
jgi:hypothetical protein